MQRLCLTLFFGASIGAIGCTEPIGLACTDEFRYGLTVEVIDSTTLAAPEKATLLAQSGSFADSVGPRAPYPLHNGAQPQLFLSTAGERKGTYDVKIKSPGYRDWTQSGIIVTANECHVNPVTVTAKLQR